MSGRKILFRLMALCLCLMLVLPLGMQAEAAACRYYSEGCPRLESADTEDFVPGCGRMARGRGCGMGNCPMYR